MRGTCIVFGCNNNGVHRLPKDETLKKQWIAAAKLDTNLKVGRTIGKYTHFCSEHFKDSDFLHSQLMFDGDKYIHTYHILKKGSVPSIFPWTIPQAREAEVAQVKATTSVDDAEDHDVKFDPSLVVNDYSKYHIPTKFIKEIPFTSVEPNNPTEDPLELSDGVKYSETLKANSSLLQLNDTVSVKMEIELDIKSCDVSVQTVNKAPGFSIHTYKSNDKAIHFYTGLDTYKKMFYIFTSLGCDVHHLQYCDGSPFTTLEPLEQFFLVLIVLRRHMTFEELSMLYLIPIKDVSILVESWIRFMALTWKKLDLWETKIPMTRVILNVMERPVKKPGLPRTQQKKVCLMKFLLGITPSGLISYVSPCHDGSASISQIIEKSGNRFNLNNEMMASQDISCGKVNMTSTSLKKGNQIGSKALKKNSKVASKRIQINRTVSLLKTYKILIEPMNSTEIMLSSDIVFVCAMLTNFRSNITLANVST